MIDRWFPVSAVDEACGTPVGSGLTEKAIFTWFASRPIAQARAAALTSLLPNDPAVKPLIEAAVRDADHEAIRKLAKQVLAAYGGKPPVVLDMFSGRAIIPLEAARAGASAIGIDLSPVATLAGRLLADYPARDWSCATKGPLCVTKREWLAWTPPRARRSTCPGCGSFLAEVGQRVAARMKPFYPCNERGEFPWAYIWTITIPCDGCKRRFPMLGSLVLRYPYGKTGDQSQSLRFDGKRR